MSDKILAFLALLTLGAFLGILVRFVPRPDLIAVVVFCVLLAAIDFYLATFRDNRKRPAPDDRRS